MLSNDIPMVADRKKSMPTVFGDTPSFLGVPVLPQTAIPLGYDAIVAGVPWEGTITWGSYSGCELAPACPSAVLPLVMAASCEFRWISSTI